MVSLTKHHVPEWFHPWLWDHYEIRYYPAPPDPFAETFGMPYLACKRCGMDVFGTTKHARNVHGDDVEVLPSNPGNVRDGLVSDEQGQRICTQEEAQAVR